MAIEDEQRRRWNALRSTFEGGEVPEAAAPALLWLDEIDEMLPKVVVARVGRVRLRPCAVPLTWAEVIEDPVLGVVGTYEGEGTELPVGVYDVGEGHSVERFELSGRARSHLAAWCALNGVEPERFTVRFGERELERAAAAGRVVASRYGWFRVILGSELASELAGECITRELRRRLTIR